MTPTERIRRYLAERERLAASATGITHVLRFDHGGGRTYHQSGSDDLRDTRALIADFYELGDREFYIDARSAVPTLTRMLALALEALERIPARNGGLMCCACDTADEIATDALACAAALLPEEPTT